MNYLKKVMIFAFPTLARVGEKTNPLKICKYLRKPCDAEVFPIESIKLSKDTIPVNLGESSEKRPTVLDVDMGCGKNAIKEEKKNNHEADAAADGNTVFEFEFNMGQDAVVSMTLPVSRLSALESQGDSVTDAIILSYPETSKPTVTPPSNNKKMKF